MTRLSTFTFCLAVLLPFSIVSASGETLASFDDLGSFSHRNLLAYYQRGFGTYTPTRCYQSSFNSPYRVYYMGQTAGRLLSNSSDPSSTVTVNGFFFKVRVEECLFKQAYCCNVEMDSLLVKIGKNVRVAYKFMDFKKPVGNVGSDYGIKLPVPSNDPSAQIVASAVGKEFLFTIVTDTEGIDSVEKLCPHARVYGTCDVVVYNKNETCCAERATISDGGSLPECTGLRCLPVPFPDVIVAPPTVPAVIPTEIPALSPAPPPSPPPPPPKIDYCCVDSLQESPFGLSYAGVRPTTYVSETAFTFFVTYTKPVAASECSSMLLQSIAISIDAKNDVKQVLYNNLPIGWTVKPNTPNSTWVTIDVSPFLLTYIDPSNPIDLAIIVRGVSETLCPASRLVGRPSACEFALHGADIQSRSSCCPHGITKAQGVKSSVITPQTPQGSSCCIDDFWFSPYRLKYVGSSMSATDTTVTFALDIESPALVPGSTCNRMTLDSLSIQLFTAVNVLSVTWDEKPVPFTFHSATSSSKWLDFTNLNYLFSDFSSSSPPLIRVKLVGYVQTPCPSPVGSKGVACEFAAHGTQSTNECCPHGLVTKAPASDIVGSFPIKAVDSCGCVDDLAVAPYRVDFQGAQRGLLETQFTYGLRRTITTPVIPGASDCSVMNVDVVSLAILNTLFIKSVTLNGFNLAYELVPYASDSVWLRILGVDYTLNDVNFFNGLPIVVTVVGQATELCPAATLLKASTTCEYVVSGTSGGSDCCPHGLTHKSSTARRLQSQPGSTIPSSIQLASHTLL